MSGLTLLDIESELSYAYLHAVAAKAGMSCTVSGRHEDNRGVDAMVRAWGPFTGGGTITDLPLDIQLKATWQTPTETTTHVSYDLKGIHRYEQLRKPTVSPHRILVVLFLPKADTDWLLHSVDQLVLKRCAYWVSLRNAPATTNSTGVTVHLPKAQVFSPVELQNLAARLSHTNASIDYLAP